MQCPQCGAAVSAVVYRCGHCGTVLPPPPGATPIMPPPAPVGTLASPRIRVLDGWAAAAVGLIWLAALMYLLTFVPSLRTAFAGEPVAVVVRELVVGGAWPEATGLLFLIAAFAAGATFLTWLFLARRNLNAFPEAAPAWGEPWTITAWSVPGLLLGAVLVLAVVAPDAIGQNSSWVILLSLVPVLGFGVAAAVVADVARNSGDGYGRHEAGRYAAKAWWWLVFSVAAAAVPAAGVWWATAGFAGMEMFDTGVFVTPASVGLAAGALCALIAASRVTSLIGWVSAEHRQRVERQWERGLGGRAAAGFDATIAG